MQGTILDLIPIVTLTSDYYLQFTGAVVEVQKVCMAKR